MPPIRYGGKSPVTVLNESIATLNEEITALWRVVRAQRDEIDALHKELRDLKRSENLTHSLDHSDTNDKGSMKSDT